MRFVAAILVAALAFAGVAEAGTKAGPGVVGRHHRLGPGPGAVLAGAGLDYNFQTGQYFQSGATPGVTVARASSKSCDDQAGNYTTVAANTLCATNKGALIEEARTNSIRNSSMQGAVVGAPGTLPTNWSVLAANGVVTSVSALATVSGIETVDLTLTGTTTGTFYVQCYEVGSQIAAVAAQVWTQALFVAKIGVGSGNITAYSVDMRQQGGAAPNFDVPFVPTAVLGRYTNTATMAASATFVIPCLLINFPSGATLNDTLRIGWPQLELGSFATSPIRTTNAAATRAGETVNVTTPPTFGATYTLFAQGTPNVPVGGGVNQTIARIDDGGPNNFLMLQRINASGLSSMQSTSGGVTAQLNQAAWGQGISAKAIVADAAADQAMSFNGGAVTTNTGALPVGVSIVRIGEVNIGGGFWNGYVERIALWPTTRLPNAMLQSLTQ